MAIAQERLGNRSPLKSVRAVDEHCLAIHHCQSPPFESERGTFLDTSVKSYTLPNVTGEEGRRAGVPKRIGLIVPSSNTTMERELPDILGRVDGVDAFTFHSSRMRMRHVNQEELASMNVQSVRATAELADMEPDVVATACLVAIMAQGRGAHHGVENQIREILAIHGAVAPVVSSAGALIDGLKYLGATKVALIAPYTAGLTRLVVEYMEGEGIAVKDAMSLEVTDNRQVANLDADALQDHWLRLDLDGCDALVLSACVQMPSLSAIDAVERASGLPTLSASTATAWAILRALGLPAVAPGAGALLAGHSSPN